MNHNYNRRATNTRVQFVGSRSYDDAVFYRGLWRGEPSLHPYVVGPMSPSQEHRLGFTSSSATVAVARQCPSHQHHFNRVTSSSPTGRFLDFIRGQQHEWWWPLTDVVCDDQTPDSWAWSLYRTRLYFFIGNIEIGNSQSSFFSQLCWKRSLKTQYAFVHSNEIVCFHTAVILHPWKTIDFEFWFRFLNLIVRRWNSIGPYGSPVILAVWKSVQLFAPVFS